MGGGVPAAAGPGGEEMPPDMGPGTPPETGGDAAGDTAPEPVPTPGGETSALPT